MALFDFGRGRVATVSGVVDGTTRDECRVRAKLTLHFTQAEPTQLADKTLAAASAIVTAVFATVESRDALPDEAALELQIRRRLPRDGPTIRSILIVALHSQSPSAVRVRAPSSSPPPPRPGATTPPQDASMPPMPSRSLPASPRVSEAPPPSGADALARAMRERTPTSPGNQLLVPTPPPQPVASPAARQPPHASPWPRRSATWLRALAQLPEGAPVEHIAEPLGVALRDMTTRTVLRVLLSLDHESFDPMAVVADRSEQSSMDAMTFEAGVCSTYLLYAAMHGAGLPKNIAVQLLQLAYAQSGLPGKGLPTADVQRYVIAKDATGALCAALGGLVDDAEFAPAVKAAVAPAVGAADRELRAAVASFRRAAAV